MLADHANAAEFEVDEDFATQGRKELRSWIRLSLDKCNGHPADKLSTSICRVGALHEYDPAAPCQRGGTGENAGRFAQETGGWVVDCFAQLTVRFQSANRPSGLYRHAQMCR